MLILPDEKFEAEYINYRREWQETGDVAFPWSLGLDFQGFPSLVQMLQDFQLGKGMPPGFVPFTCLWLVTEQGRILGFIEIRHFLSERLAYRGGHIGYGIRHSERKKGYARRMLRMALSYCRDIGLMDVMITCAKTNLASARTIRSSGGTLDSEDTDVNGETFQRYWFHLK